VHPRFWPRHERYRGEGPRQPVRCSCPRICAKALMMEPSRMRRLCCNRPRGQASTSTPMGRCSPLTGTPSSASTSTSPVRAAAALANHLGSPLFLTTEPCRQGTTVVRGIGRRSTLRGGPARSSSPPIVCWTRRRTRTLQTSSRQVAASFVWSGGSCLPDGLARSSEGG